MGKLDKFKAGFEIAIKAKTKSHPFNPLKGEISDVYKSAEKWEKKEERMAKKEAKKASR